MRLNECPEVKEMLSKHLGINLTVIDGADLFLGRLKGVTEPEKKRKIIGETFIDLFEKEAIRIEKEAENTPNAGKVEWFLQGTVSDGIPFGGMLTKLIRGSCTLMCMLLSTFAHSVRMLTRL